MTSNLNVREQLKRTGSDFRFWGRSEAKEPPNILFSDEQIMHALNGRYEKGFAMFCATDQRLLLLDKKPLILCFEDMRYEMVSEVDYAEELLTATLTLRTPGRTLRFQSFRINKLRKLTNFIQERVSHMRHVTDEAHGQYYPSNQQFESERSPEYSHQHGYQASIQPFAYPQNPQLRQSMSVRRRVPKFSAPHPPQTSQT